jgi:transcriptional regulator of acetoin/glycerol metabolism
MEHQRDVRCVAAPVRDYSGRVVASLSVSGPATRISKDLIPSLARRVRGVAAKLSARLGYTERRGHGNLEAFPSGRVDSGRRDRSN